MRCVGSARVDGLVVLRLVILFADRFGLSFILIRERSQRLCGAWLVDFSAVRREQSARSNNLSLSSIPFNETNAG